MLIELLVATVSLFPAQPAAPLGALPNGGKACLIVRCDPRACMRPARDRLRCGPRGPAPRPRMIPATSG